MQFTASNLMENWQRYDSWGGQMDIIMYILMDSSHYSSKPKHTKLQHFHEHDEHFSIFFWALWEAWVQLWPGLGTLRLHSHGQSIYKKKLWSVELHQFWMDFFQINCVGLMWRTTTWCIIESVLHYFWSPSSSIVPWYKIMIIKLFRTQGAIPPTVPQVLPRVPYFNDITDDTASLI